MARSVLNRLPRAVALDVLIVALLFGSASWWGARYVASFEEAGREAFFFQSYFEPAVMLACGRGFTVAASRPPAVEDFLFQRQDTFDCASLPPDLAVDPDAVYQYAWFYLMVMVGLAWKILGVSWSGLAPLFGVLFGSVIVLAYGLFRLAVPHALAVLPAAALATSSLHLQNLPHLRDYAKAPFVLALILLLAWMVIRPRAPRALLAAAALYGLVMGVGYGFRTDLLANAPPLVIALVAFLPGGITANLRLKAAALLLATATFVGAAWPAASFVTVRGGCQWHVLLLGLDDSFNDSLGVAPASYSWISAFSDEYIHTAVNAYHRRTTGGDPLGYCSAEYDAASGAYLREIHLRFPGDLLTRAYASVLRVTDLPFYWWHESDATGRSPVGTALTYVGGLARIAVGVAVLVIGAHSVRLGLFALALVLYFGGLPSLQFATRHMFHLEFIGWWAMAFLAWQGIRHLRPDARVSWPHNRAAWQAIGLRAGAFAALVAAIVLLPFPVARAYQHRESAALVGALMAAPRVTLPVTTGEDGLLTIPRDALVPADAGPMETVYLDVHLDPQACPAGATLGLAYDPANPFYDFSRPVRMNPAGATPARILTPVYRHFQGLSLGDTPVACVTRLERLSSVRGFSLLPILTIPAAPGLWPEHQTLKPSWWTLPFRLVGG